MAKILICDDSILARKQLKDVITTKKDVTYIDAANGQEAIDLYKSEKPDMVFIDIVMPIKDGSSAIKEITEFDPNAKIIVVSSVGTQAQLKTAIENGAKDFIQKPLDATKVEKVLDVYLEG